MADSGSNEQLPEDLSIAELRQQLREARIDRDGWRIQAKLSDNHLRRILRSPAWRVTKPFRILNLIAWKIKPDLQNDLENPWTISMEGPTVWSKLATQITFESKNAKSNSEKIAVLAQWSKNEKISTSTTSLIQELRNCDYEVFLVSACESTNALEISDELKNQITIIRKPNYGYDFGSWTVGLMAFPEIKHADEVLILNDSNAGPFGSLMETLRSMQNSPFDITGITDSLQIRYHIQSYFMHFKNGIMQKDEMWDFWSNIRHQDDKQGVIHAYELGLTSRAQSSGIFVGALYPWNLITDYWENPTIHGAERLIDLGLPIVKREILRNSSSKEIEKLKLMISNKFELDLLEIQKFFSNAD